MQPPRRLPRERGERRLTIRKKQVEEEAASSREREQDGWRRRWEERGGDEAVQQVQGAQAQVDQRAPSELRPSRRLPRWPGQYVHFSLCSHASMHTYMSLVWCSSWRGCVLIYLSLPKWSHSCALLVIDADCRSYS